MLFSKAKPKQSPIWQFEGVLFDTALVPHIEKADAGDFDSLRLLAECFLYGDDEHPRRLYLSGFRVKKNADIARHYNKQVLDMLEGGFKVPPHVYAHELVTRALIEAETGSYEQAKEYYMKAIKHLVKKVPPEEWDFWTFQLFRYSMLHFGSIDHEQYEFPLY